MALDRATDRLRAADCFTPGADAVLLAGHLLSLTPGQVRAAALRGDAAPPGLDALVTRRAGGTPVQHITGRAPFRNLELQVGPGVFIPRPETELLAQAVIDACASLPKPFVVELCAGSAAIAVSLASEVASVRVVAVEVDPAAARYAAANISENDLGDRVELITANATDPATAATYDGRVNIVVVNPPYVPDGATISHDARYDPEVAMFGGPTGRELPILCAQRAFSLLTAGGWFFTEHHDSGQDELCADLARLGFEQISPLADLNGRPRFIAAHKPIT